MLKEKKQDSTHTKPSLCDSCHSLSPLFYCCADAAYLCSNCDFSIHSTNPLARRHRRVPVFPISAGSLVIGGVPSTRQKDEEEEVDEYLDLMKFRSCEEEEKEISLEDFEMSYEGFNEGIHCSDSLVHVESLSSIEATLVPQNSINCVSNSQITSSKGTSDIFHGPPLQMSQHFTPMDREARVLRYREKRKTRKFQKIIRYASRKAYAETRPRIKGRFAKRTDVEHEVIDQMFVAPVMVESGYGFVHSY
uniref:CONSTANS-like 11 n=1 Tax=Erycina pusilla TaxID=154679 RepID=M9QS90_9ASPA|nr:CONSTANS-like 11 [Erycina pusilla]